MLDPDLAWQYANLVLPLFAGAVALVVGVGIAGWIVALLFRLMRGK